MPKECGEFKKSTLFKFIYKTNLGVKVFKSSISLFFYGKRYDVIIKKENISRVHCRDTKMKYLKKKIMVHSTQFSKGLVVTIDR